MKCVKNNLNKVLIDPENSKIINDVCIRVNYLTIYCLDFLLLWLYHRFNNAQELPFINEDILSTIFDILSIKSGRGAPKQYTNTYDADIVKFHNLIFVNTLKHPQLYKNKFCLNIDLIHSNNISQVIDFATTEILTSIDNTIRFGFPLWIRKLVNASFICKDPDNPISKIQFSQLKAKLSKVKDDIINGTNTADQEYAQWISDVRTNFLPNEGNNINVLEELAVNPQRFLYYGIKLNKYFEEKEFKLIAVLPQRSSLIPKNVTLDTTAIRNLFLIGNKTLSIRQNEEFIWQSVFKMDEYFKKNNYLFNHIIHTNGHSISIIFATPKKVAAKNKRSDASVKTKNNNKDKSETEKQEIKQQKEVTKKTNKRNQFKKKTERDAKRKEEFKNLTNEEKELIKKRNKEFPYFDALEGDAETHFINASKIFIDPGKNSILTILGTTTQGDDKYLKYTKRQRKHECQYKKFNNRLEKRKSQMVKDIEKELATYNKKTCNYDKFYDYLMIKHYTISQAAEEYQKIQHRQYKFYQYILRQKSEAGLVKCIKKTYGKDVVMVYGDWSCIKQMKGCEPTPNVGLKRRLKQYFKIYNIDEFRTSIVHHKSLQKCNNLIGLNKEGHPRKIHTILTYKMENGGLGCINRDVNSVNNMRNIVNNWIINGNRIEQFKRSYKFELLE